MGVSITPDRLVLGIIILTYFGSSGGRSPRPKEVGFAAALEWALAAFAVILLTSYMLIRPDAGLTVARHLTTIFNFPLWPLMAFFMARRIRYSRAMLDTILKVVAAIGAYLGFTAIFEAQMPSLVFPRYIMDLSLGIQQGRSRGPFLSAVTDGGILVITLAGLACLAAGWTGKKRVMGVGLMLVSSLGIYFTQTRAIWLALAGFLLVTLALRTPMRRNSMVLVALMLVGFVSGGASKFSLTGGTLFSQRQETVEYRYANFDTAISMFKANPLFGVGYGQFLKNYQGYFGTQEAELTRDLNDGNHSTILGFLAELGLVGFTTYIAILGFSAGLCIKAYRDMSAAGRTFEANFAGVGMMALLSLFLLGLTNDLRWDQMFDFIVFWLLGIVASIYGTFLDSGKERNQPPDSSPASGPGRKLGTFGSPNRPLLTKHPAKVFRPGVGWTSS
jgi:O-antigen ligase